VNAGQLNSKEQTAMYSKAVMVPSPPAPSQVVIIDEALCKGCNRCVNVCHSDVMVPSAEKGKPPVVLYPDECWFCGCCVAHCPQPKAIKVAYPLHQRIGWKRKETGEYFRIGMRNPPPPNTRPAVGCDPVLTEDSQDL
jgi:NAD-dependent dihydropyrimidine dehydrogenase PreA subunit